MTWVGVVTGGLVVLAAAPELTARWWIRARSGFYPWPPWLRGEVRQHLDVFPQISAVSERAPAR